MNGINSVIKQITGMIRIKGATDNTPIGNVGDALKMIGSLTTAQAPFSANDTLGSLNDTFDFDNSALGYGALSFQVSGTWAGTISAQMDNGANDFKTVNFTRTTDGRTYLNIVSTGTNENNIYTLNVGGVKTLRLKMTAYTSGTATIHFFATAWSTADIVARIVQNTSSSAATDQTRLPTIETEHQKIHEGKMYHVGLDNTLANNATWRFLFTPGANTAHLVYNFFTNGVVDFHIYENPTGVTTSTSYTPMNRSRGSSNTAGATLQLVTAVTGNGTEITDLLFGSSGGGNSNTQIGRNAEWDFPNGKTYLIDVTSNSSGNNVTMWLDWYEG